MVATKAADDSLLILARSNTILGALSPATIDRLLASGQTVEFGTQEVLLRQGDPSDCGYLILEGDLEIHVSTTYGEILVARVTRGALVGEIGVFTDLPRNATVRACSTVRALRLDREHLLDAAEADPALLRSVIGRLGSQIGRFNSAIGLYTNAVAALEQDNFDLRILDELKQPSPELVDFAQHFRRMSEQIVQRRAQQAEMASAVAIQRAMLPIALPAKINDSQFDVFAHILPARQVGGDLYDVADLGENRIMLTIGDVCGKGIPAALFMAVTQTIMRLTIRSGENLKDEIEAANRLLVVNNKEDMFSTLFCGVLDLSSDTMIYCNCGHNPPLILRAGASTFQSLRACGPPLAIGEEIKYAPQSLALQSGDMLLLYTDGVTEAENNELAQFGTKRLEEALLEMRGEPARKVVEHIVERLTTFADGAPQSDDITCVAIVRN